MPLCQLGRRLAGLHHVSALLTPWACFSLCSPPLLIVMRLLSPPVAVYIYTPPPLHPYSQDSGPQNAYNLFSGESNGH